VKKRKPWATPRGRVEVQSVVSLGFQSLRRLAHDSNTAAASDTVTHGSWIIAAVALGILTVGAVAVPGTPVHTWLHCHMDQITGISSQGIVNVCLAPGSGVDAPPLLAPAGTAEPFTFDVAITTTNGDSIIGAYAVDQSAPGRYYIQAPAGTTFTQGSFYLSENGESGSGTWMAYGVSGESLGTGPAVGTVTFPAGTEYVAEQATFYDTDESAGGSAGVASLTAGSQTYTFATSNTWNGALNSSYGNPGPITTPNGMNTIQLQS